MTALTDFSRFVADEQAASIYKTWAKQNPGELARWGPFRDAILAGQQAATPAMLTEYGKGLVDAGIACLDAIAAGGARVASLPLLLNQQAKPPAT